MNSSLPLAKIHSKHQNHVQSVWTKRALKQEQRQQKRTHLQKAIETSLKIFANIGLSVLALTSVKQLLPYHSIQQAKLAEIDVEIGKIKPRVEKLEDNFGSTFDPILTRKVIEKNTYKVDPNLSPIFFIEEKRP